MSASNPMLAIPKLRLTAEEFGRLRDLLAGYSGIHLDTAQQRVLEAGLTQRMALSGETLDTYERRISSAAGRDELQRLVELIANHETFFFRNGPHLRALRETILLELQRRKAPGAPIRIWSAGCATGEEAYSLAIIALETFGRTLNTPLEIWATDISDLALEKARAGFYRGRSLNNVTPLLLERYFQRRDDGYLVSDAVRSLVRFAQVNLLDVFPPAAYGIDAIFCQNVTIYFRPETRRGLMERFHRCLPDDGLLFLGFSETLWNVFDGFRSREVAGAYIYQKVTLPPPQLPAAPVAPAPRRAEAAPTPRRSAARATPQLPAAQDDDARIQKASAMLDSGNAVGALESLRGIHPNSAQAPRALVLMARAHADRGDMDLALAEARGALEIDALRDDAYLLIGTIYARQQQWSDAIRELERARYLNPDAALISYHLAMAYQQAERTDQAAREFRNALRKLAAHRPEELLEGVEAGWLQAACAQQLALIEP